MSEIASWIISPEDAAARSGLYRLLARLWLGELDLGLLRELRSPPLCDSFTAAGGILPVGDDERTIEELAIDYCRLFVGPTDHLPPIQSVWKTGQFQAAASTSMKHFVDVVGYDMEGLPAGMLFDHLGVQLDVMASILGSVSTWQQLGAEGLDQALELASSFFTRHLLWPVDLLNAATQRAATDFYRSTIVLTGQFLESEMQA